MRREFSFFRQVGNMDGRTVPKIRTGTEFGTWYGFLVRDLMVRYVVRIFGTDFFQYGTWYGIWSGLEPGTVRGTDFGTDFFSVRYVVRTKISKN